jgi:hypothetical protein
MSCCDCTCSSPPEEIEECDPIESCDKCTQIRKKIEILMRVLYKRAGELNTNQGNLPLEKPAVPDPVYGYRSVQGEQGAFLQKKTELRRAINRFTVLGCGELPDKALEYLELDTPSKEHPVYPPRLP